MHPAKALKVYQKLFKFWKVSDQRRSLKHITEKNEPDGKIK
jgi:hypothetical protein